MKAFSTSLWHLACFDPVTMMVGTAIGAAGSLASGMMGSSQSAYGSDPRSSLYGMMQEAKTGSSTSVFTPPTPVTPPTAPDLPAELKNAAAATPTPQAPLPTADGTSLTSIAANRRAQANAANQSGRTSTILSNFSNNSLGGNRGMGSGAGTSDYSKRTLGAG